MKLRLLRGLLYWWDVLFTMIDSVQLKYWILIKDYCDSKELESNLRYGKGIREDFDDWKDIK